jgi:hypothetical protein
MYWVPRLTNDKYYDRHRFLCLAWKEFPALYTILPPTAQWDIHRFYKPTADITKEELLAYRKQVSKDYPSLPNRAGQYFSRMYVLFRVAFESGQGDIRKFHGAIREAQPGRNHTPALPKTRRIHVASIVNPEIDLHRLARALIDLESQQAAK